MTKAAYSRDPDRTIEEILAVTVTLIEEQGEGAVRVQQVARLARRTMGAVYHHFGSREGLVEAARVRQFRGQIGVDLELLGAHMESSATVEEFLLRARDLMSMRHAVARRDERWARIDVLGSARKRPKLAAAIATEGRTFNRLLVQILERGQERGLIDPSADPLGLAALLQSIDVGFIVNDIHPDRAPTHASWMKTVVTALAPFLGPGAPRGGPRGGRAAKGTAGTRAGARGAGRSRRS